MVNKIFEILEAKWLFNTSKVDAVIETKSLIHSIINFSDGSSTAHIANADMRLPISFALLGEVNKQITPFVDFTKVGSLEFREINSKRYPIWEIKDELISKPELGVVINSANEIATKKFMNSEIKFLDISDIILKEFKRYENCKINSLEDVFMIDKEINNRY
jgi:1-deoxy-D-xylulose-5-phosphate reductoisomerase